MKFEWKYDPLEYGMSIDVGEYLNRRLYDDLAAARDYQTAHTFCAAMHSPQDWSHPQCYFCSWAYQWYKFWDCIDEVMYYQRDLEEDDCDCTCCNH